jgi:hypothetical protein
MGIALGILSGRKGPGPAATRVNAHPHPVRKEEW